MATDYEKCNDTGLPCQERATACLAYLNSAKALLKSAQASLDEHVSLTRWYRTLWCKYKCTGYLEDTGGGPECRGVKVGMVPKLVGETELARLLADGYEYFPGPITSLTPISVATPEVLPDIHDVVLEPTPYVPSMSFADLPPSLLFREAPRAEPVEAPISDLWKRNCCSEARPVGILYGQKSKKKTTSPPKYKQPPKPPQSPCEHNVEYYQNAAAASVKSYDAVQAVYVKYRDTTTPAWRTKVDACKIDLKDPKNFTYKPASE